MNDFFKHSNELTAGIAYVPVYESEKLFKVGDRICWCEGCYGHVVFIFKNLVGIITDDGISRLAGEKYISKEVVH